MILLVIVLVFLLKCNAEENITVPQGKIFKFSL